MVAEASRGNKNGVGRTVSDAARQKLSDSAKTRLSGLSDEKRTNWRAKLSASSTSRGKPRTDEVKRKLSEAHKGKTRTPQELANLSRGHRKGRKYTMIAPDGTVYEDIDSLAGFGRLHGMSSGTVSNILTGKCKSKAGWRGFITKDDDNV